MKTRREALDLIPLHSKPEFLGLIILDEGWIMIKCFRHYLFRKRTFVIDTTNSPAPNLSPPSFLHSGQQDPVALPALPSWTSLTRLTIDACLPTVQTLANVVLSLPNLETLKINVHFLDPTPPALSGDSLPPIQHLAVGPRGYALFSWLAQYAGSSDPLQTLSLRVGSEDPSPLELYATTNSNGVDYVEVILHQPAWARGTHLSNNPRKVLRFLFDLPSELSRGLSPLNELFGLDFVIRYPEYTATPIILELLEKLAPGIASPLLMDLGITVPKLRLGLRDQLTILHTFEAIIAESSPLLPDDLVMVVSEMECGNI
ncbi:hypothetical protein DFP72DRAFT_844791 [Ephemerocybe angulata]|uniref:Uncharacterized protein n=1 Tax=Ephemerocybe angulata TaxID=980116 RepID=A0A8H6I518_9AGAR|nr:hypothetical protein DFP72DRAFT_844791 [Tulosesus angulatus]